MVITLNFTSRVWLKSCEVGRAASFASICFPLFLVKCCFPDYIMTISVFWPSVGINATSPLQWRRNQERGESELYWIHNIQLLPAICRAQNRMQVLWLDVSWWNVPEVSLLTLYVHRLWYSLIALMIFLEEFNVVSFTSAPTVSHITLFLGKMNWTFTEPGMLEIAPPASQLFTWGRRIKADNMW